MFQNRFLIENHERRFIVSSNVPNIYYISDNRIRSEVKYSTRNKEKNQIKANCKQ